MYKYQCSKKECGNTWILQEGFLNGFTLTCPSCGKGRGIFVAQLKKEQMTEKDWTDKEKNNKE
jgi:uncharacterized protein (DUF983 family)